MADSIEQKIVNRALAVLAAINGSGSYQTTLGETISPTGATVQSLADFRPNWDESELPAISVIQPTVTIEDRDDEAQQVFRKMPLLFVGTLARGTDAATARKFIGDIMRAIRSAGDKWVVSGTPLAHHTDEGLHGIEMVEGTYEITGVQVEIDIYYAASHLDMMES